MTIESQTANVEHLRPLHPVGAVAATIARRARRDGAAPIVYVAETSRRASEISTLLQILIGEDQAAHYPRWDGLASDGVLPSVPVVGARMSLLRRLTGDGRPPVAIVTTAAALMRRVPPRKVFQDVSLEFVVGLPIDLDVTRERLIAIGYRLDDRCDEPGEATIHGHVIEFFPAAAARPSRVEHEDGTVKAIRTFDPLSQRSTADLSRLVVDPASERIGLSDGIELQAGFLRAYYDEVETFFDYLPEAETILEADTDRSASAFRASLEDLEKRETADFLTSQEWEAVVATRFAAVVEDEPDDGPDAFVPRFAGETDPLQSLEAFASPLREDGYRVALAGPAGEALRLWARRLARLFGKSLTKVETWAEVLDAPTGALLQLDLGLRDGFVAHEDKIVVIALRDLAGHAATGGTKTTEDHFRQSDDAFGIGDAVVHFDHGVGILEGLESVGDGETEGEAIRLRFADDATLLVPLGEVDSLWRYGGKGTDVTLDKLNGNAWVSRRNRIVAEISRTAERMVAELRRKDEAKAEAIRPDRVAFERFCERFPHEPTSGQSQAIDAILADLKSGRPMDRLLCGDVGFGKTEVALRAVAAAAFAGRQVAVVAPTTVLARQHFELFRRRFDKDKIEVAMLSRLQTAAELRHTKERLADGTVRILVATHAICGKDVAFDDLALVVIDEEQRFGSRHKNAMRELAPNLHVLAMTATPIPRTLQAGFVGLHDVSVISTPPSRRRPVRTSVLPFEDQGIADALLAEKARGGQSFVVCPRIEDIEPMEQRLRSLTPELDIAVLHGEMRPADVERTMIAFAEGKGDILLATNIIESGVDVEAANTMVICRPDRFGLAQLHQLRGRVGRGARRGVAILATEPDAELGITARERLSTLERLTALGAGFDISARDLDLRGAGELLGEEQAGHLQLVGLSLYRRTLERALGAARGEQLQDEWRCDLNVGISGTIPASHIPEPERRIELAVSLDRVRDELSLDQLRHDTIDCFGPMPPSLETNFRLAALRLNATALGIRKLDAGPKAVAATFSKDDAAKLAKRITPRSQDLLRWSDLRLILDEESEDDGARWGAIERLRDEVA